MPMLPIVIICHASCEPPGYLCAYFDKRDVPYKKINILERPFHATELDTMSGLIFMGGPYSVNDNHDWIDREKILIREAFKKNIPMMGVCFGAQLISKVLGAEVKPALKMEAGWHKIMTDTTKLKNAHALNLEDSFEVFEWHEDTFSIPDGAIPIFKGNGIENQGYVYGKILAMQFHLEMTEQMVSEWLDRYKECLPKRLGSIQSYKEITKHLDERIDSLHTVADKIYDWWLDLIMNDHSDFIVK